ncbi:MAG: family 43 glycosylhydrolase [Clostridia bacterium]|nr:family 43 glycosylhydrolase [Clostridia bacterium]
MKKLLSLALITVLFSVLAIGVLAMEQNFINPVALGADPFILKDDGTYYLYVTGDNLGYRVYSSKNLVEWTAHGHCLVKDDVYLDPDSKYENLFWAPEVIKYEGKYYMAYTAQHRVGIAVADNPLGPFKSPEGSKYLLPYYNNIDGNFFLDDDGKMYLYYVTQQATRVDDYVSKAGNNIWGCELDMNTLTIKSDTVKLLQQWDETTEAVSKLNEGPFMIKHNGKYYLTFSADKYYMTSYSVNYAVSDSPLGEFKRDFNNPVLKCDDLDYADADNPHLYGPGHHSFVEAPNGKDMLIVYHAHRTGKSWNGTVGTGTEFRPNYDNPFCGPRNTCIDLAWFDASGVLRAGSKDNPGVPTAVAQPVLEGTELTRKTYFTGAFEKIPTLPTVYVAYTDGSDDNTGAKDSPLKTIEKALGLLKKGGTIVLTQGYTSAVSLSLSTRGPLYITGLNNSVHLEFKYINISSAVYFDNLVFYPKSVNEVSAIVCNFNDVVMGEGVSCINRPRADRDYPLLIGGKWYYTGEQTDPVYGNNFKPSEDKMTNTKAFTFAVLGGTWQVCTAGSVKGMDVVDGTAPGATVVIGNLAKPIPGLTVADLAPVGSLGEATEVVTPPVAQKTEIKMTIDSLIATVNGESKTLDAAPIIRNSRTMLPVRFVAENLGATVGWDDATKTVSVKSADTTIEIVIGAATAKVNGKEIALDSPAFIENSRTYLPVRVVAENLGATVSWDDATKTATLVK